MGRFSALEFIDAKNKIDNDKNKEMEAFSATYSWKSTGMQHLPFKHFGTCTCLK